jgi:hypothetical protein
MFNDLTELEITKKCAVQKLITELFLSFLMYRIMAVYDMIFKAQKVQSLNTKTSASRRKSTKE